MILAPNWKAILKHAWSIRLMAVSATVIGLDAAFPIIGDLLPIPRWSVALLTMLLSIAAIFSRLMFQPKLWLKEDPDEPA